MISHTSEAKLRIAARCALHRAGIAKMVSNVRIVRIWTNTDTHLSNRIPIKSTDHSTIVDNRAFSHTLICIVIAPSIVTKYCLSLIWTSRNTLLILLRCISALRTNAHAGVVYCLSE